ncbi:mRNA (guanine-N(7))-methyltransferase domain, partial [Dillenia turbinata]
MKRSYSDSASTSPGPPHSRFGPKLDDFFPESGDHYSARTNQTLKEREASPIIHLKKLNNWLYARQGDAVVDLACGKGGDLIKWDKAKIGYHVGIDIADGSIEDCRSRYSGDGDQNQRCKKFTARLICGDCYEVRLDKVLEDDVPFDIISCQFAMHYSWPTEVRARRALANVSALLRPGGIFIGTMPDANVIIKKIQEEYKSSQPFGIRYKFHPEDAVDCPEWIVPFHVFKSLAEEYDLELVSKKNSRAFVEEYMKRGEHAELMPRLGALVGLQTDSGENQ